MTLLFLNDVANDAESTQKKNKKNHVIIASLKSVQQLGKLINKILGSRLMISSLSASLAMSTSVLKALRGKLDIKRNSSSNLYVCASEI